MLINVEHDVLERTTLKTTVLTTTPSTTTPLKTVSSMITTSTIDTSSTSTGNLSGTEPTTSSEQFHFLNKVKIVRCIILYDKKYNNIY
jgi:hypothetical protein